MKNVRVVIALAMFLVVPLYSSAAPMMGDGDGERRIVILFTHDLHSYFLPDRLAKSPKASTEGGYAKMATLINRYRDSQRGKTILVDAGDFSMGSLFHTSFSTDAFELRLMARMGYEVITFGNHDFDFHLAGLANSLDQARRSSPERPVIVASNVVFPPSDSRDRALREAFQAYPVREYTVLERNGLKIGIFGVLGKDAKTDSPFASPVTFGDPVASGNRIVNILRDKEKVDIVVCLSHSGTSGNRDRSEDEIYARKVKGIDVIVSGHTHTTLSHPIRVGNTLIVSAGSYGHRVGVLEMAGGNGQGARLVSYDLATVSQEIPDDPEIAREVSSYGSIVDRQYLAPYNLSFDQVLGECGFDMESLTEAHAHPGETGIGDMITDAYRYAIGKAEGDRSDHVHLAIQPLGNIRSTLLQGSISTADVFRVLSLGLGTDGKAGYPLLTAYLTGKDVKKLLEVETTISHMKEDAHLQLSGARFVYNPRRMPFDRVVSVSVGEKGGIYRPLESDKLYRVAMNYYTAKMVQYVGKASYGLLTFTPRDRDGRPMRDIKDGIVGGGALLPGMREIKEWSALGSFIRSFPDTDGNGVPNVPERYRGAEGRIVSEASWNPAKLVAGATFITYGTLAIVLAFVVILVLSGWLLVSLIRRRRGRA